MSGNRLFKITFIDNTSLQWTEPITTDASTELLRMMKDLFTIGALCIDDVWYSKYGIKSLEVVK